MDGSLHGYPFAIACLATWRLTYLLNRENGPFDVIVKIHLAAGDGFFGQLLRCFLCLSLWVAAPMAWCISSNLLEWFLTWLGLSGAACICYVFLEERPRA